MSAKLLAGGRKAAGGGSIMNMASIIGVRGNCPSRLPAVPVRSVPDPIVLPRWRGGQPLDDRIARARAALIAFAGDAASVVERETINAREALPRYDVQRGYGQLKPALAAMETALTASYGERVAHCIGLGLLLDLVVSHERRWRADGLDAELKPDFVDSMHRILDVIERIERGGTRSSRINNDNYCKELAICLHRLIPAGGQLIDPRSGVPRSLLVRPPLSSIPRKLGYVTVFCQGFKPFAEFHTHERMRHLFTPDGWEYCFRRLPAVFRSYPELKGIIAGAWFFDPQLETISPNLSFVREVPTRWGGIIVRESVVSSAMSGAFELSQHRRELYDRGLYQPTIYYLIAAKSRILKHARDIKLIY
jgi:hypothetical protein